MSRKEQRKTSRKKNKLGKTTPAPTPPPGGVSWKGAWGLTAFCVALTLAITLPIIFKKLPPVVQTVAPNATVRTENTIDTFEELFLATDEQIQNLSIARMNLLCSLGLPGSENIDVETYLKKIEDMAHHVSKETARNYYRFQKSPQEYGGTDAKYRAGILSVAVKEDYKLGYNMELHKGLNGWKGVAPRNDYFFKNSQDVFISGMLSNHKKGTCSSMPVLLVAVGRKLGYPVYLVACKGHLFCRWDDGKEKFAFDGTGQGFQVSEDDRFLTFPKKITAEELKTTSMMKSMTPKQELVTFLSIRRSCLLYHKRDSEALLCVARCVDLEPEDRINHQAFAYEGIIPQEAKKILSRNSFYAKEEQRLAQQRRQRETERMIHDSNRANQEHLRRQWDRMHQHLPAHQRPPNPHNFQR